MLQVLDADLGKINVSFSWSWEEKASKDWNTPRQYYEALTISLRHTPVYIVDGKPVNGTASAHVARGNGAVITDASQSYAEDGAPVRYMHYALKRAWDIDGYYGSTWDAAPVPQGQAETIRQMLIRRFAHYASQNDLITTMRHKVRQETIEGFALKRAELINQLRELAELQATFESTPSMILNPTHTKRH